MRADSNPSPTDPPGCAFSSSVLIPSFRRPAQLIRCLSSLANQGRPADEIIVVWQADDQQTLDAAESCRAELGDRLRLIHSEDIGVVPAENAALDAATGDIILLIDDDAVASPDWISRHLSHYPDGSIGAVGGPADDFNPDGTPFPRRAVEPIGKLTWLGRSYGNMYDQIPEWRSRSATPVDHLVGFNMSLRRGAFGRFEAGLKPYWQGFEMDACLQVKARGYRVMFDFGNVVQHFPTNTAYTGGREGDLQVKVLNAAYNQSYVLSRHSRSALQRWARAGFQFAVGSVGTPGLAGCLVGMKRFGKPFRELCLLKETWKARWLAMKDARTKPKP